MRSRKTNYIDVDFKAYVIYYHEISDSLIAFDSNLIAHFHELIGDNDGIENIPNDKTVNGFKLNYNKDKNAYDLSNQKPMKVKVNELDYVWIQYPYK